MSDTNTNGTTNTVSAIPPDQMAAILQAVAQAINGQQPAAAAASAPVAASTDAGAGASTDASGAAAGGAVQAAGTDGAPVAGAQALAPAAPAPDAAPASAQPAAASGSDPEQLALLKKIDANVTGLSTSVAAIRKDAIRNGAIAGGVAGGVSGGIVATGIAFIRAHLGL